MNFTSTAIPLTQSGLDQSAADLVVDDATIWAIIDVETSGCGFLPDRRPTILFERHIFHRLTGGRLDNVAPAVSAPSPGGYGAPGAAQYERLALAMRFNEEAAVKSTSWGLGQVMGFNHRAAGYGDVWMMVEEFCHGEDEQLGGMARFIERRGLDDMLQMLDWPGFALGYNGPAYRTHEYDRRLQRAYDRFRSDGCPDMSIRTMQMKLMFAGFDAGPIDGRLGPKTRQAEAEAAKQGVFV